MLTNFYVGETCMSIERAELTPGGSECIVYTTLSGSVGALLPFTAKEVCFRVHSVLLVHRFTRCDVCAGCKLLPDT